MKIEHRVSDRLNPGMDGEGVCLVELEEFLRESTARGLPDYASVSFKQIDQGKFRATISWTDE